MRNHRCDGSLKNEVSIICSKKHDTMNYKNDIETWRLFHYIRNTEYDCFDKAYVAEIEYCPFCSEKL